MVKTKFLPDGFSDMLQTESLRAEFARRRLLQLFSSWGYELVSPSLVEFAEAFLLEEMPHLYQECIKFTDGGSAELLGIRPDITSQISRIDFNGDRNGVNRYCYFGPVLRNEPRGIEDRKLSVQFGAELYGTSSLNSDVEAILLAREVCETFKLQAVVINFSDSRVAKKLFDLSGLSPTEILDISDILQRKSPHELNTFVKEQRIDKPYGDLFHRLLEMNGAPEDVLKLARTYFSGADFECFFDEMERSINTLTQIGVSEELICDYAEIESIDYYDAISFSFYCRHYHSPFLSGGRYSIRHPMQQRERTAVGFSGELDQLLALSRLGNRDSNCSEVEVSAFSSEVLKSAALRRAEGENIKFTYD